jgi:hypothetical protein
MPGAITAQRSLIIERLCMHHRVDQFESAHIQRDGQPQSVEEAPMATINSDLFNRCLERVRRIAERIGVTVGYESVRRRSDTKTVRPRRSQSATRPVIVGADKLLGCD